MYIVWKYQLVKLCVENILDWSIINSDKSSKPQYDEKLVKLVDYTVAMW